MGHNVIIFLVVEVCQRGCVPQFENHCYRAWRQENLLGASPRPRFSRKFLLKGIRVEHNTQCQSHTHTHSRGVYGSFSYTGFYEETSESITHPIVGSGGSLISFVPILSLRHFIFIIHSSFFIVYRREFIGDKH